MKREVLEKLLSDASVMNGDAEDFTIEVAESEMRNVLTQLRHMQAKGQIFNYDQVDEGHIDIEGYVIQ